MEKRIKRIELCIALILVLLIGNLVLQFTENHASPSSEISENHKTKELPFDVTIDYTNKIVYKVKTSFNNSNWDEFHSVFGEYAKAQISVENVSEGFKKLKSATENISTYVYSHYTYEGNKENAEWFEIFYKCRFKNGKGTIKLSTRTVNEKSEIVGVVINLDEL